MIDDIRATTVARLVPALRHDAETLAGGFEQALGDALSRPATPATGRPAEPVALPRPTEAPVEPTPAARPPRATPEERSARLRRQAERGEEARVRQDRARDERPADPKAPGPAPARPAGAASTPATPARPASRPAERDVNASKTAAEKSPTAPATAEIATAPEQDETAPPPAKDTERDATASAATPTSTDLASSVMVLPPPVDPARPRIEVGTPAAPAGHDPTSSSPPPPSPPSLAPAATLPGVTIPSAPLPGAVNPPVVDAESRVRASSREVPGGARATPGAVRADDAPRAPTTAFTLDTLASSPPVESSSPPTAAPGASVGAPTPPPTARPTPPVAAPAAGREAVPLATVSTLPTAPADTENEASRLLEAIHGMREASGLPSHRPNEVAMPATLPSGAMPVRTESTTSPGFTLPATPLAIARPVTDPAFPGELAATVNDALRQGIERAEITVSPRDLGPIRIELSLSGELASVAFSAAQPDTRSAIEQSLPVLESLLAEHGLLLSQSSIDPGSTDGRRPSANGGSATGPQAAQTSRGQEPAVNAPSEASSARAPRGLLDLFA